MGGSYCVRERKPCLRWVEKYFKDCLCNVKDDISFSFGLISLVCWGVAEIPQIITNFRTKSSHGVSLAFLFTWVAGDIFNLVGCLLEPATLPTQFYTALLYTITTIVLVLQSLYYDHLYKWRKRRHRLNNRGVDHEEDKKPLKPKPSHESGIPIPNGTPKAAPRREYYYTSARSLAGSGTPPFRTYMRAVKSGPSAMELNCDSSSDDEASSSPAIPSSTQPRPIPRATGTQCTWSMVGMAHGCYIYGRSPTTNMVEQWDSIKPNMPWLLDAVVCVALDLFIILQYIYYKYFRRRAPSCDGDYYEDARKS
ncbi:hypothetical protein Ahy_A01g004853 isoform C [Arachis hypogaea]|uniref:Uncharacterized protein n=1 Tax=Arachis hypogaea TaxID=3818 RepID=A0A445EXD3_ARAHY|nr:hypothetical protein Ahy_A01g004853 isoform C [Arachis hypogaea]